MALLYLRPLMCPSGRCARKPSALVASAPLSTRSLKIPLAAGMDSAAEPAERQGALGCGDVDGRPAEGLHKLQNAKVWHARYAHVLALKLLLSSCKGMVLLRQRPCYRLLSVALKRLSTWADWVRPVMQ